MKTLFTNVEQVRGAVMALTSQYDREVKTIDDDKGLVYKISDEGGYFLVKAYWASHVTKLGTHAADDNFKLLKTDDPNKLEKYLHDTLETVTAHPVEIE